MRWQRGRRPSAILDQVGDEIEIRPGILSKDTDGRMRCKPIFSRIVSLYAEQNDLQFAVPGGLIGTAPPGPTHASHPPLR